MTLRFSIGPSGETTSVPSENGRFAGSSFASFGEIAQGRLSSGQDFLFTLPIDLWSSCDLICTAQAGPTEVVGCQAKVRKMTMLVLEHFGLQSGHKLIFRFQSNIPIGKGLSSSTADLVAALRSLQAWLDFQLSETEISSLLAKIEPHDALHYCETVAYDHRKGELIREFGHIPSWKILAIDHGGTIDTVSYNERLEFEGATMQIYDELFSRLSEALGRRDDILAADCATRSAKIHAARGLGVDIEKAASMVVELDALGLLVTHSGTCTGFLFPSATPAHVLVDRIKVVKSRFRGDVFLTHTLRSDRRNTHSRKNSVETGPLAFLPRIERRASGDPPFKGSNLGPAST